MKTQYLPRRSAAVALTCAVPLITGLGALAVAQTPAPPAATTPPAAAAPAPDPTVAVARALIGKPAPAFTLPDQNDKTRSLADSKGKWVVLAFYPADMTRGCTFQNISYTQNLDKFAPLNAVVYTVSTQDTASKKQFCSKEGLKHTLLSDVGGKAAQQYGVLSGKFARRYTFYIAPDGTVADVDTRVNTQKAAEDSLARLARLQGTGGGTAATPPDVRTTLDGKPVVTKSDTPAQFVGAAQQKATVGSPVPDFVVTNVVDGKSAGFTTLSAGKKATVLVWVSTQCPVSNAYNERMEQIATSYASRGVQFVGINSNATEPTSGVAAHAKTNGLTFPIYKDDGNKVADQFEARVTPEVFIADEKGTLVWHGPIDDQQNPNQVSKKYLQAALDAVLAGQTPPAADKRPFGCGIQRAK
jgi:peroxiredoxin